MKVSPARLKTRRLLPVLAMSVLLAACGGSSGGGDDNNNGGGTILPGQEFFMNGPEIANADSLWACYETANVGTDRYWVLAFYTDGTGTYVGSDGQRSLTWLFDNPTMGFQIDADVNEFEFTGITRNSASEFTANLNNNGQPLDNRVCQRANTPGTRTKASAIALSNLEFQDQ